ncbi:MAG: hypothetical protein J6Y28_09750 [Acholeplasmatales bacterium]|nr:hypothetical protein [Methanobrevibacter sp.]MBP5446442.1 hypothetical protein [Acholeplasmatales bacterium]
MIKQVFKVEHYWKVIVYYNIDYNLFYYIERDLIIANISNKTINNVYNNMVTHKAKAVTISNIKNHISIVLFNNHKSIYDYINSIVHEAEHIKQAMLECYNVKDIGEPPAYTIGYLAMKMLMVLKHL